MTDLSGSPSPDPTTAVLSLQTKQVISADELATLIKHLAGDYARVNRGRSLVVARIETGSLFIWVRDAVVAAVPGVKNATEYLKAAEALSKFIGTLKSAFGKAKQEPRALTGRSPGLRTVREAVRIAAERGAAIEVDYTGKEEQISIRLSEPDSRRIQTELLQAEEQKSLIDRRGDLRLLRDARTTSERADIFEAAIGDLSLTSEVQRAVSAIVGVMNSIGLRGSLRAIASELDNRGRSDIARLIRVELE